jgi:6-phosphogluconolactonase (cycloisomerase 2 family)
MQTVLDSVPNPSYVCEHPTKLTLYVVHGDFGHISSYKIHESDGTLELLNQVSTEGSNPVHLIVSDSGKWLLVVNYATGNIVSIPIQDNGSLDVVSSSLVFDGVPGPNSEQKGSHPHQISYSKTFDLFCIPDKGLDRVSYVKLDEATGRLTFEGFTKFPDGAGPRHMAMHPSGKFAYVVGELNSTLYRCLINASNGHLQLEEGFSTIPPGFKDGNSGAGIVCTQNAIYISNRGHDSVAKINIDPGSGKKLEILWQKTGGATPRFITLDEINKSLLVANESSDSIFALSLNSTSSTEPFELVSTGSPVCIVFKKGR